MFKRINFIIRILMIMTIIIENALSAITMKQFQQSMDMMRSVCAPKFKLAPELLDGLRKGNFVEDKDLKCYTSCIAQMAGTLTKKKEISLEKTLNQMEVMLPPNMKEPIIKAVKVCNDVQHQYKDLCDKTFYSAKCMYGQEPDLFIFP